MVKLNEALFMYEKKVDLWPIQLVQEIWMIAAVAG